MKISKIGVIVLISLALLITCGAAYPSSLPAPDAPAAYSIQSGCGFTPVLSETTVNSIPSAALQPAVSETAEEADPYFTEAGVEEVKENAKGGYWLYRSSTLYVEVKRFFNKTKIQTYFVADIRFKDPERERAGFSKPKSPGRTGLRLYQIARNYGAVIAVNGDYMHMVEKSRKGIIIRNGKVYLNRKNADTLAFYPGGTMRIFKPGETTPAKLLSDGVKNTYSFGPTLIHNGRITPNLNRCRLRSRNPRSAVGMVEPYHYIFVEVDGRRKGYSKGMTLVELAALFKSYGCTEAYNLDGGRSATMSFMGKNISKYAGSYTGQRRVPDAVMMGTSKLVPKK